MIADMAWYHIIAFELFAVEKLLDALNEVFDLDIACLLDIIIIEHVQDGVSPDTDVLALTEYEELVKNFLVHEAEGFSGQELKSFDELLSWDILGDH